jgi:hypothetical protein
MLLRVINKNRWMEASFLAKGDLQADALLDLRTSGNALSVWHVEGDESNLNRVVALLAAGRDRLSNFDYALIDPESLIEFDIKIIASPGSSCDEVANEKWHRELGELSVSKIVNLAGVIATSTKGRKLEKAVRHLLRSAVEAGHIQLAKLKEKLASEVSDR